MVKSLNVFFKQKQVNVEETTGESLEADVTANDPSSESSWREKFNFTLSLIHEPRYLLPETLVAEQLKLTLKQQAFKLEQVLLRQSIRKQQAAASSSSSSTESSLRSHSTAATILR